MNRKSILIASGLIIVCAVLFLFLSVRESPPRIDRRPHEALGRTLAREAVKLREGNGRVFLIARDTRMFRNPASDVQLKSFFSALKQSGVMVAATNWIKLDPLRVVSVPAGDFVQMMKKGSDQDVVVSFLGAPVLEPEQFSKLPAKPPKVIAVCTGGPSSQLNARRSFEQKLLSVAVLSRKDVPPGSPTSADSQTWFDYLFTLATPVNLSEIANPSPARR